VKMTLRQLETVNKHKSTGVKTLRLTALRPPHNRLRELVLCRQKLLESIVALSFVEIGRPLIPRP